MINAMLTVRKAVPSGEQGFLTDRRISGPVQYFCNTCTIRRFDFFMQFD
jgi:hypothetical protein